VQRLQHEHLLKTGDDVGHLGIASLNGSRAQPPLAVQRWIAEKSDLPEILIRQTTIPGICIHDNGG
jgi:hypothetical protein